MQFYFKARSQYGHSMLLWKLLRSDQAPGTRHIVQESLAEWH